jgi:hypothetical protein
MMKIMNPEILPTDDYYYQKIKGHHLYFVKQLHEGQEEGIIHVVYTVSDLPIGSIG